MLFARVYIIFRISHLLNANMVLLRPVREKDARKKRKYKDTRLKNTFGIILNKPEYKAALEKSKNES